MSGERQNAAGQTMDGREGRRSDGRSRRNVTVSGRRTSVSLEMPVWEALAELCRREKATVGALFTRLDALRGDASLASAARVFALEYFRSRAEPRGRLQPTLESLLEAYAATHR